MELAGVLNWFETRGKYSAGQARVKIAVSGSSCVGILP